MDLEIQIPILEEHKMVKFVNLMNRYQGTVNLAMSDSPQVAIFQDDELEQEIIKKAEEKSLLRAEFPIMDFGQAGTRIIEYPMKEGITAYRIGGTGSPTPMPYSRPSYTSIKGTIDMIAAKTSWNFIDLKLSTIDILAEDIESVGQSIAVYENQWLKSVVEGVTFTSGENYFAYEDGAALDWGDLANVIIEQEASLDASAGTRKILWANKTTCKAIMKSEYFLNKDWKTSDESFPKRPLIEGQYMGEINGLNMGIYLDLHGTDDIDYVIDTKVGIKAAQKMPITVKRWEAVDGMEMGIIGYEMLNIMGIKANGVTKLVDAIT
jgi:hypothetical protein